MTLIIIIMLILYLILHYNSTVFAMKRIEYLDTKSAIPYDEYNHKLLYTKEIPDEISFTIYDKTGNEVS